MANILWRYMPKYLVLQYHDLYNLLSDILAKTVYTQRGGRSSNCSKKLTVNTDVIIFVLQLFSRFEICKLKN